MSGTLQAEDLSLGKDEEAGEEVSLFHRQPGERLADDGAQAGDVPNLPSEPRDLLLPGEGQVQHILTLSLTDQPRHDLQVD